MSTSSIWSRFRPRPRNTLFLGIHIATPIVAWMAGFSWFGVLLALVVYYVRVFGITAGYHRYFSHRAYKMGRVTQFLMAFLAQTACQGACSGGRLTTASTTATPTSRAMFTARSLTASGMPTWAGCS